MIEPAGLQQFLDLILLIQGKNLKTLTKADAWDGTMQQFSRHRDNVIHGSHLSGHSYVDIGKETCPNGPSRVGGEGLLASRLRSEWDARPTLPTPQTLLWRRCCLDSYSEWIGQQDPPKSPVRSKQFYPISLLHDSGSLALETHRSSPQRQGGLFYLYSSVKEVFVAGDAYPFSNPSLEKFALDPQLRKTQQYVGDRLSHDPITLMRAI